MRHIDDFSAFEPSIIRSGAIKRRSYIYCLNLNFFLHQRSKVTHVPDLLQQLPYIHAQFSQ